jgi:hypothetical protein
MKKRLQLFVENIGFQKRNLFKGGTGISREFKFEQLEQVFINMATYTKAKLLAVLQSITNWTPDQIEDRIFRKTALNSLKVDQIKTIFKAMKDEGIGISYQANKPVLVGMLDKIIDCINTNVPLPYPSYGYVTRDISDVKNVSFTNIPQITRVSYNSVAQNTLPDQPYPVTNNNTSTNRLALPSATFTRVPPAPLVYPSAYRSSLQNGLPPPASSTIIHRQPSHHLVYAAPVVKQKIPPVHPTTTQKLSSRDQTILNDLLEVEGLSKDEISKALRDFPVDQEKDSDSVLLWLLNQRHVSFRFSCFFFSFLFLFLSLL